MYSPTLRPLARSLALGVCLLAPVLAAAQVTYFQQPPTPEQLRAALLPASAAAPAVAAPGSQAGQLPPGVRHRGIVWNLPANGAPATATASASAPPPQIAAARPAASGAGAIGPSSLQPAAALPINFSVGSSRIDPNSIGYIESIAAVLRSDPGLRLVIEGHTDDSGAFNRNMVLSWDRALGVFRTLVENYGIDPSRLQPVGKGPMEPMPGTSPSDGTNRRVQFRLNG